MARLSNRDRLESLIVKKKLLESFVESDGWKMVETAIEGAVRSRRQDVFSRGLRGQDGAFEAATIFGEIAGLEFARALPEIMLVDLEADIQALRVEIEEEEEEDARRD